MAELTQTKDSSVGLTMAQQNELAAQSTASKFLNDVSESFSGKGDWSSAQNDSNGIIYGLKGDLNQQLVLKAIATDINDTSLMGNLGLRGTVQADAQGNVTALEFNNARPESTEKNVAAQLETSGEAPEQAQQAAANHSGSGFYQPLIYDTVNPANPNPPYYDGSQGVLTIG